MRVCDKCRSGDKVDNVVMQTEPNQEPRDYACRDLCKRCRVALITLIKDFLVEDPKHG